LLPPHLNLENMMKKQAIIPIKTLSPFFIATVLSLTYLAPFQTATAQPMPLTDDQMHAIGVDAYLYFYPLLSVDITRRVSTNVEAGKEPLKGPMNTFLNAAAYPPGNLKLVVRFNFDTLYSVAYLDLTKEPVVVSSPDTGGRYFLLPMLDMWTDVFASPGWRTTGTQAQTFLIIPPGYRADLRDRAIEQYKLPKDTQLIDAPTPYVVIIGRTKTDGPQDYDAVHKIQAGYKIALLSQWGQPPQPVSVQVDPSIDMKTPPKTQVDTMPAARYFSYAAELLKVDPPHITDQPMIAQLKKIGIEPGKSFDFDKADPAVQKALIAAREDAQQLMQWALPRLARVTNGWSMNTNTMGVYGNYYLKRAIVAQQGLGANVPEDAIYPLNLGDEAGRPLDGANKYTLHFNKGDTPPVYAFWSVTLYDSEGFQVPNALNRFAISSWMPFHYNADGSLDLYFQNESPGPDKEVNWLPGPKGPFNLCLRLYAPKSDALTGKWNPPPVMRVQGLTPLTTQ